MSDQPIYVTQPFFPPLEEFIPYLEKIWDSKILTNCGPLHQQLENELASYLGVKHISLFNNGTNALLTALQALQISGEVITTPYSFIATTHSIMWNGLTPVFVDIDPETLNLDPKKIEAAITKNTKAIMPVHCYGNSCDTTAIKNIAEKYGLKIIYDAAHAFGVEDSGGSILRHGDLSILSFHATKVFNTFEGGAIVCHDSDMKNRIDQLKNFGIVSETEVGLIGTNGKMSEVNSAFGLLQLKYLGEAVDKRKTVDGIYRSAFKNVAGIKLVESFENKKSNYSYFPVLVGNSYPVSRDNLYQRLKEHNIFPRRYFYPLISEFLMYRTMKSANPMNLPVATKITQQVLCLPMSANLCESDILRIVGLII